MAILHHPNQKEVLMCDFGSGGFREPEMVKKRPVVVLSHRRYNGTTCLVVPLSTVAPHIVLPFHHQMMPESLPRALRSQVSWVKGNMLTHVALERLDRVMYRSSVDRSRRYETTLVVPADWIAIQRCIRASLGLSEAPDDPPGMQ